MNIEKLSKKEAEVIDLIKDANGDSDPEAVKDTLEDGEALAALGITDQEAVEGAHAYVCSVIEELKVKEAVLDMFGKTSPMYAHDYKIDESGLFSNYVAVGVRPETSVGTLEKHSMQFIDTLIHENPGLKEALKKAKDEDNQAGIFCFSLLVSQGVSADEAIKSLES